MGEHGTDLWETTFPWIKIYVELALNVDSWADRHNVRGLLEREILNVQQADDSKQSRNT